MKTRSRSEDTRICIHEAAHLVAAHKVWLDTPDIATVEETINEGRVIGGSVTPDFPWGAKWTSAMLHNNRNNPYVGKEFRAALRQNDEYNAIASLAGLAAEHRRSRYSIDGAVSLLFAKSEMLKYGFPSTDLQKTVDLLKVYEPNKVKREKWLRELCGRTCQHVWEWWPDILRVAAILQERRTLDRDGIEEVYEMLGVPGEDRGWAEQE